MSIQIGTVDGLINIQKESIICLVKAIYEFSKGGIEFAKNNNVSVGSAFQRFVEPVYNKTTDTFDFESIKIPVYTKKGNEASPARLTFCKKMGLLNIDDKNDVFELTPIANELYNDNITIEEYAFILLTKQGVFKNDQYKYNLFAFISEWFINHAEINDSILVDSIRENLEDDSLVRTRGDIIVNALCLSGLIKKVNKEIYVLSNLRYADIFNDFYKNKQRVSNSLRDNDINYINYMGSMQFGIFDILTPLNECIYTNIYPNLKQYMRLDSKSNSMNSLQRIYYGAPGTGKSNEIKELTSERGKDGIKFSKNFTFRTTFHPDSDYSTFVGAYKPSWSDEKDKIVYGFRPQTFLKAYVEAWKNPEENVALVIEEINRGNCAQIFGDIFQLLDREASGLSKYPIEADVDMQSYIEAEFKEIDKAFDHEQIALIDNYYEQHYEAAFEKIKNGEILALPMNLSILATMNTSDQSLFPMDSAFKRRWEWVYTPIVNAEKNWKIEIDGYQPIDWWTFLERINKVVAELTISEDKQLGYFFCIPDKKEDDGDIEPTIITADRFVGKVIFYLWNDVFKDYAFDASCCKDNDGKEVLFAQFYGADGKTINTDVLVQFFNNLKDLNGKESPLAIKRQAEIAEEETEAEEENSNEE